MTAVTKCFPGKSASGRGDRVPSKEEQALCRPFLEQEVLLVAPRVIIPVGGLAILKSWEHWGRFICPGCGASLRFAAWILMVVVLDVLFVGIERMVHVLLNSDVSLSFSFLIGTLLSLMVVFILPMVWTIRAKRGG